MPASSPLAVLGGPAVLPVDRHCRWPDITTDDRAAVSAVLDRGVLCGPGAPEVDALSREYADYLGVRYCLPTNSGTAGLHCAAAAVGVEPGDEVIVPAYTFVATAHAMAHQGAKVVFCDVDPRTYNLDPACLPSCITDRTRAVVAVAVHGQPPDLDDILAITHPRGIATIEDDAQAHGIEYRGRKLGGIGDAAASSLNASKNLFADEGGFFLTNDETHYQVARRLTIFGEDPVPLGQRAFWSHGLGWNYRNRELSAALARSVLRRLDSYNERAAANAAILNAGLHSLPGIRTPYVAPDRGCSYWKYALQIDPEVLDFAGDARDLRDRIIAALNAEGVRAVVWQPHPVPAQPAFRRASLRPWHPKVEREPLRPWDPAAFPVASRLCDITIGLGAEDTPLFVQQAELMDAYVEAVTKVMVNLPALDRLPIDTGRRRL